MKIVKNQPVRVSCIGGLVLRKEYASHELRRYPYNAAVIGKKNHSREGEIPRGLLRGVSSSRVFRHLVQKLLDNHLLDIYVKTQTADERK